MCQTRAKLTMKEMSFLNIRDNNTMASGFDGITGDALTLYILNYDVM